MLSFSSKDRLNISSFSIEQDFTSWDRPQTEGIVLDVPTKLLSRFICFL